jgi:hypothetical protein
VEGISTLHLGLDLRSNARLGTELIAQIPNPVIA